MIMIVKKMMRPLGRDGGGPGHSEHSLERWHLHSPWTKVYPKSQKDSAATRWRWRRDCELVFHGFPCFFYDNDYCEKDSAAQPLGGDWIGKVNLSDYYHDQ